MWAKVPTDVTAGSANIVMLVNGTASYPSTLAFTVSPKLDALSPTTVTGGTVVTLTGSNFGDTQGSSAVYLGGSQAAVQACAS